MTLHEQIAEIRRIASVTERDVVVCEVPPDVEAEFAAVLEAMELQVRAWAEAQRLQGIAIAKATLFWERLRTVHERFESAEVQGKTPMIKRNAVGKLVLTLAPLLPQPDERQQMVTMLQEILSRLQNPYGQ